MSYRLYDNKDIEIFFFKMSLTWGPLYNNLVAEKGLKHLERTTEKKLYKELDRKYEKGIKVCKQFINNEKSDFCGANSVTVSL